jgi:hypothetical protein
MVGQTTVVVEARQIGAANVAHLQLLVTRRAAGVRERLKLTLFVALRLHRLLDPEELLVCSRHFG